MTDPDEYRVIPTASQIAEFDQAWEGTKSNYRMVVDAYRTIIESNPGFSREFLIAGLATWIEDNCDDRRILVEMLVAAAVQEAERD